MKFLLKFLKWFAIFITTLIIALYIFDVDYLLRAVKTIYFKGYTTAFLEDYKEFPNREIKKGIAQPWSIASDYNSVTATQNLEKMIAFGTKVILMDLIKTQNLIPFPWQKVLLRWH
jgi:hypothetical protein